MTIEYVIHKLESITRFYKNFWGTDDYDDVIKTHEFAIDTMRKYQKIEQIYSDYLKYMNPDNLADRIGEVLEDGNDD